MVFFYWKAQEEDTSPEGSRFKNWPRLLGPAKKKLAVNNEGPAIPSDIRLEDLADQMNFVC